MARTFWIGFLTAILTVPAGAKEPTAAEITAILQQHCYRCHGADGAIEGGFNAVLDLPKLLQSKKLIAGKAEASPLFRRIADGSMPPKEEKTARPTAAEIALVKDWINAGAKIPTTTVERTEITPGKIEEFIAADLAQHERRSRRFLRYFSFAHLANAGYTDDELQTYRHALAKLLNSLSWHPDLRTPEAIDPQRTIFRIDLRWLMWDATLWNRLFNDYPYGILRDSGVGRVIAVDTGTRMALVRGDWFIATASRAPLYYELLQFPGNLPELERELRIDSAVNIQQERVQRLGFNGSGVSRFNRVLERHTSVHGAFWRTYDFDEPTQNFNERTPGLPADRRNVFAFPLGPGQVESSFQHAGGEAIFALPNGLHAYYIMNAANERLDKAPNAIVSDPRRPDRAVEAGVSCMSCHITGILPKNDQIRDHVQKNRKSYSVKDLEIIEALYPGVEVMQKVMAEDAKKYEAALQVLGIKVSRTEVVSTMTLRYEADMDLRLASAEVGLSTAEFQKRLAESEPLRQNLGALQIPGGTVSRAVWQQTFGDLVRELRLGTLFQANTGTGLSTDNTSERDPLEAYGNSANAVTFTSNGATAIVASGDRSVRLWDIAGRRDQKRLIGHTATVWAVAVSNDGKRVLSSGSDGTAKLWDLATGQELKSVEGHRSLVSAVAFTPEPKWFLSGGFDGQVILWNRETGQEIRRWSDSKSAIHALCVHPTASQVAIAASGRIVLWDYAEDRVVLQWVAHAGAVTALDFSQDGARLLSGGDDALVKVWNLKNTKKPQMTLPGHFASIRSVQWSQNNQWAISSGGDGAVRLWDLRKKLEVAVFRKHSRSVVGAAFLPSGSKTVSVDDELGTEFWDISKWLKK